VITRISSFYRKLNEIDDDIFFEKATFSFLESPNQGKVTSGFLKLLNMGVDCELEESGHLVIEGLSCNTQSLGNVLSSVYLSALRAFQRNNTFMLHCDEEIDEPGNVLQHYISNKIWTMNLSKNIPDLCQCPFWPHNCVVGLNFAVPMIRETLRQIPPPFDIDDVTIHIRCGDILNNPYTGQYGYPSYDVYKELLAPFNSVGLLTSSFDETKSRPIDAPHIPVCIQLVEDMAKYFRETFPHSVVTVRHTDTVEDAFGRMIHSKQVWCNPSTFCIFPAIATTGQAFILKSSLYSFVENIKNEPNITLVQQDFINAEMITKKKLGPLDIIGWLRKAIEIA
jgi:hypothetical protein